MVCCRRRLGASLMTVRSLHPAECEPGLTAALRRCQTETAVYGLGSVSAADAVVLEDREACVLHSTPRIHTPIESVVVVVGGDRAVSLLRVEIWPTDGVMEVSSDAGPTIRELIDLIRSRDNHRCRPKRRRYCGAAPQLERRRLLSPPELARRAESAPTPQARCRHTMGGKVSLAASGWVLPGRPVDDDAHS